MAVLKNRAKMSTSTTGTGTITLGSAEDGYQTFADAGVANADVVRYIIEDGNNFEIGTGTYTSSGTTLSRTVSESSNSNNAINLSGSATVFIGATAEDIPALYAENTTLSVVAPIATGNDSISLGSDANSSGTDSIAIMNGNASGMSSLAAVIANNTTTYGAQGSGSISIGTLSKATAIAGTAVGYGATSTHVAASAFGTSATTTATNQIALGGSGITARISGAYNLPTSDGTNGQVLTTNGSGAVTFADAGGGGDPDLYRDNASSAVTPTASGTNAVALGSGAVASGALSFAFGSSGSNAAIASGSQSISMGSYSRAYGSTSIGVGYSAEASSGASGGVALGQNARSAGNYAVAFAKSRAAGADSLAGAISTNSSSYGATGSGAVALGNWAKASGSSSGAFGFGANATNWGAYALGAQTFATGDSSVSLGRNSLASATYSICIGNAGQNNIQSSIKFSGSQHANQGDAQIGLYPLMADTTDATATAMVTNHQSTPGAGTANQIVLPNNSAYAFHGTIVARQKAGDGTACAAWKVEGLIRREGSASTTVLVNSATTVLDNTPNWGMALSADTTNGGLKVQVTGAASTNIRWTTSITTSELTYA